LGEEHIELLKKLISIPSPSTREAKIAEFIAAWFSQRGFDVKQLEVDVNDRKAGPTLLATHEFERQGKSLLFGGHTDTVEPVSTWDTDPYTPVIKGNKLFGLGAYDMKGGITALMLAAERLSKMDLGGKISCALVSDFEAFSTGTYVLCSSGLIDDYDGGILPDEYTDLKRVLVQAGGRVIFDIELAQEAKHLMESEKASNPLKEAAFILTNLDEMGDRMLSPMSIEGGLEHFYPSVPESCRLIIDGELLSGESPEDAIAKMSSWLQSLDLKSDTIVKLYDRPTPWMKPYRIDPEEPILKCLEAVCSQYGIELEKVSISYVADNYYVNISRVPMLFAIGPSGADCHAANEWVDLDSVDQCANMLVDVGKSFLG
jgi:acetylornithine deacetylase/succinyl-diaminopimelate desuccinylase-like protein